jgi:hypothetical protein
MEDIKQASVRSIHHVEGAMQEIEKRLRVAEAYQNSVEIAKAEATGKEALMVSLTPHIEKGKRACLKAYLRHIGATSKYQPSGSLAAKARDHFGLEVIPYAS